MRHDELVRAVERESLALAAAAEGNFDVDVVSCPGWTIHDLVWHIHEVQWFWGTIVEGALTEPPDEADRPLRYDDPAEQLESYRNGVTWLVDVLRNADPGMSCWTWAPQKDAAFVIRHQAQEAAIHRWDAESAAGRPKAIDRELAADSVEEFLMYSTAWVVDGAEPLPGPVRLEAKDVGGAWTVMEDDERRLRLVGIGHGPPGRGNANDPVTTVCGDASDLLLGLYRRVGPDRLSIEGNPLGWPRLVARNDLD